MESSPFHLAAVERRIEQSKRTLSNAEYTKLMSLANKVAEELAAADCFDSTIAPTLEKRVLNPETPYDEEEAAEIAYLEALLPVSVWESWLCENLQTFMEKY